VPGYILPDGRYLPLRDVEAICGEIALRPKSRLDDRQLYYPIAAACATAHRLPVERWRSEKALAREIRTPVLALSQLDRRTNERPDHRPILSDLRESGAIEQDADIVAFVYRGYVYDQDPANANKAELIIAKQRNGPVGTVQLRWTGMFTRFEDWNEEDGRCDGSSEGRQLACAPSRSSFAAARGSRPAVPVDRGRR
jgi:hypothetical protein